MLCNISLNMIEYLVYLHFTYLTKNQHARVPSGVGVARKNTFVICNAIPFVFIRIFCNK